MANTTCPEIASRSNSDIVLSTYERTNGTTVVIGCKDFGRHVSGPTSVVCSDTGAWSETPKLKCEIGLDEKEKIILAAALVSAALVLITLFWICCYCCCCRRRRRHYGDHYKGWRGWRDNWRDGWSGWTSRWFSGSSDDKNFKRSHHFYDHSSNPSKSFVEEYGYSNRNKDGRNSINRKSKFFSRSRRHSDGDKPSVYRQDFSKQSNFLRHSGKYSDVDQHSDDRKDFSKRKNILRRSGRYSDRDKHSDDRLNFSKRSEFLRQSGRYSDMDKHSDDRLDFSKRPDFIRRSGKHSDMDKHLDDRQEHAKRSNFLHQSGWHSNMDGYRGDRYGSRPKGWRGWTDSLRENWIDWRSRTFGDSPADGSVRRRDHHNGGSYPWRGHRHEHGRYSDGDRMSVDRHDMMRSRRYSDEFQRGRRYSDSSLQGQRHRYATRNASYDSRPDEINNHRVRRYSDPMIYRSEYAPRRQEVSYESRIVPRNDIDKPSYNIIRVDDSPQSMIERAPTTVQYIDKPVVRYAEHVKVLDPVVYTDPHQYHIGSRQSGALYGGVSQNSGVLYGGVSQNSGALYGGVSQKSGVLYGGLSQNKGTLYGGESIKHSSGHGYLDGLLHLPPISIEQLSKVVNLDSNYINKSYSTGLKASPRVVELDGDRLETSQLVGPAFGRINNAHYEVLSVNPSSGHFWGQQEFPIESSTSKGGHYTLYQGKGKSRKVID